MITFEGIMAHPTFDQFVSENLRHVKRIINHRTWGRKNVDREDILQEILLHFWKAWPSIDWKSNPKGLLLRMAARKVIDCMKARRIKPRNVQDDDAWEIISEGWSLTEYVESMKRRLEPPPEPLPWVYDLAEEDFRLIELASAVVATNGCSKAYMKFMAQWLPPSLGRDYAVIRRWYKRIDNLKAKKSTNVMELKESRLLEHDGERGKLLAWARKDLAKVCLKIRSGCFPPMSPDFCKHELAIWIHRLYDLNASTKRMSRFGNSEQVSRFIPSWINDGDRNDPAFAMRACRWFRVHWKGMLSDVAEFGWKTWDEIRRIKRNRRAIKSYDRNREKILDRLKSPEVKKRRGTTSREWNRSHREKCSIARRRWRERKLDASSSASVAVDPS